MLNEFVADARRLTDLVRDNKHAVAIEVIPRILMVLADLEHRVVGLPSRFAQLRQHLDDEVDDIHARLDNLVGTEDTVAAEEILDRLRGVSKGLIKLASAFSA